MPKRTPTPHDFEASLTELESIVAKLESGQISLNDALGSYERGSALLRQCQETLISAENKIKVLEQGKLYDFCAEIDASP